ncbi:sigma-54 dependent transcriptional regulator [Enterovibrio sp. ZSDZ35]|uniref:Sigma-54 dependent transcriptional regulator n=1 Tax=Enterovibrio qingdaonensis TaxID=2899818 RepID=A0ABT5QL41_9GAMM|nr:sigma-54 dependent transcriptional regulator [Enterovibrio sp. ZSDZ35]MDD1781215.1 sigma-54 dependent transcriptional regulator [Enterovibrio sp. ZSDZ35]
MTTEIWIIDDERSIRDSLSQTLDIEGFMPKTFASAKEALSQLDSAFEGVIISDINMPQMDGIAFLNHALAVDKEFSIVMLTGHGDISTAVSAMRGGAYDFLEKPFSTDHLLDVIRRGLDKRNLVIENRELRRELEQQSAPGPRILGNCAEIKQLRRTLSYLKDKESPLLMQGERGTGKELAARFMHDHSERQDEPFISLKCRLVPDSGIEQELFGNPTDTNTFSSKHGKIFSARKGTLFLDGIEALPQATQRKLSIALRNTVDMPRVIASTRVDLQQSARLQKFDQSLYEILSSITLHFPPLREREEDTYLICQNFLRTTASRFGIAPPNLNADHKAKMAQYTWPGNVTELRNFAERWVLMGEEQALSESVTSEENDHTSLAERLTKVERSILFDALNRHNGRLKEVQQELGLARKTLYEKLKKHHLDKESFKA